MRRMMLAITMAGLIGISPLCEAKGKSSKSKARSAHAKTAFKKANPCPPTGRSSGACPGYVIDHVVPLKRGGPDHPNNMQWQTLADAKAKDRYE